MTSCMKHKLLGLLFLFAAHALCASGAAQGDTTRSKYPINDPRNPNCPCHKYQAEADKEYARMLKEQGAAESESEASGSAFGSSKGTKKVQVRNRWFQSSRSKHARAPKRKAQRDRLSRCFHF
jgi:hypothetical protein